MCEEVILLGFTTYAMRRAKEEVGRTPALPRVKTTTMSETAKVQTRKGVEGVFSRRQMDNTSGRGTGIGSSFAALHRAVRSPEEQPRLSI